jgi:hypothetical protein
VSGSAPGPRILLLGLGALGSRVLDLAVRLPGRPCLVVAGRDLEALRQRAHLAVLAAMQLGHAPEVSCVRIDLQHIDATAETLARLRPDIVFHAASLLAPRRLARLPPAAAARLTAGPLGPWLPLQLVLVHRLMQAVARSGQAIRVVNASYPDVVNPLLAGAGLAPWIGAGNLANNVPGLRRVLADRLACPLDEVDVRLVMQHAVSHRIHRHGTAGGAPFHLTALRGGEDVTAQIDPEDLFRDLATAWRRPGGAAGQLMTAASSVALLQAMTSTTRAVVHAPAPHGLPGGYPVELAGGRLALCLPAGVTATDAVAINEAAQRFDGIEWIAGGVAQITGGAAALVREILGYEGPQVSLADADAQAAELLARVRALRSSRTCAGGPCRPRHTGRPG